MSFLRGFSAFRLIRLLTGPTPFSRCHELLSHGAHFTWLGDERWDEIFSLGFSKPCSLALPLQVSGHGSRRAVRCFSWLRALGLRRATHILEASNGAKTI